MRGRPYSIVTLVGACLAAATCFMLRALAWPIERIVLPALLIAFPPTVPRLQVRRTGVDLALENLQRGRAIAFTFRVIERSRPRRPLHSVALAFA